MESISCQAYVLPLALIPAVLEIVVTLANQHSKLSFLFFFFFNFLFGVKSCEDNKKNPMYLSSTFPRCQRVTVFA